MQHRFFKTQNDFRSWLEKNHAIKEELWVAYHRVATGRQSLTWSESVDQALCFGWIDGLRKRIDEETYKIRFTPRKPKSLWSAVNLKKIAELEEAGLMTAAGRTAFDMKSVERSKVYSYERENATLDQKYLRKIKRSPKAWAFWLVLAPYKKKVMSHWVMSAKKEETRERRLAVLIESAEEGQVIPSMRR